MFNFPRGVCFFLTYDPAWGRGRQHHGGGRKFQPQLVKPKEFGLDFSAWAERVLRIPSKQDVLTYTYRPLTTEHTLLCGCPPDRLGGGKDTIPFPVFTLKVGKDGVVRHVCGREVYRVKV